MQQRAEFRVRELDCAEEVAALRGELTSRPGILALDFDVLNARLSVEYENSVTAPPDIVAHVARTGMHAEPWQKAQVDEPVIWYRQKRPVLTTASGLLLVSGMLIHGMLAGNFLHALQGLSTALPAIVLYISAAIAGAWLVVPRALSAVRRLRPDMNLLMCVAVVGAMALGDWIEAATTAFLFSLALLLEQWSLGRTRRAIAALLELTPPTARFVCPEHGTIEEQRVENIPLGATVVVRAGERIPLDGVVLKGQSHVSEAPITGESIPVSKREGSEVFAGTINGDGSLEFRVTKRAADTTLSRIVHLVQEAQSRRAPSEQWVERFAVWYTPAMLLLAVAIAAIPPLIFGANAGEWFYRGLVTLVIACPCALVISTPVTIVSALTAAARFGVLIKGGMALESAAHLQVVAFDKTGTLTRGQPAVQTIVPFSGHNSQELLERAKALEVHSRHPMALAVVRQADAEGIETVPVVEFRELSGRGAEGLIRGRLFWIGSHRLMHEKGAETPDVHARALEMEDAGHSVVAVGNDSHVCGLISIADEVRPDVSQTIRDLKQAGVRQVVMLTGDNEQTAHGVQKATGIDLYRAELLPEDKLHIVEDLVKQYGTVAMVGDGVNDAPALAQATLGIAMGAIGTAVAVETADVVLMADDLSRVPWLMQHARRALRVIRQNVAFALGLKLLFVVLTLCGMASLWLAIAADTGATLLVIFNGMRLLSANTPASRHL